MEAAAINDALILKYLQIGDCFSKVFYSPKHDLESDIKTICSFFNCKKEDLIFARTFKGIEIREPDIVSAYREYYRFKKKQLRHWKYTRTPEPDWINENQISKSG